MGDTEDLDPRIKQELEKLNALADEINRYETLLDDAREDFEKSLKEGTTKLAEFAQILGSCVAKARPYYKAVGKANLIQMECEKAALEYETATTVHEAAREMISVAEENLLNNARANFDGAWQDMVNHANVKVMKTNVEAKDSEDRYKHALDAHIEAEELLEQLYYDLYRPLMKSRPYYEEKSKMDNDLHMKKNKTDGIQHKLHVTKLAYTKVLRNLEQLSADIHRRRQAVIESGGSGELTTCQDYQYRELQDALLYAKSKNLEIQQPQESTDNLTNASQINARRNTVPEVTSTSQNRKNSAVVQNVDTSCDPSTLRSD